MLWSMVAGCLVLKGMLHFRCEFGSSVLFSYMFPLYPMCISCISPRSCKILLSYLIWSKLSNLSLSDTYQFYISKK